MENSFFPENISSFLYIRFYRPLNESTPKKDDTQVTLPFRGFYLTSKTEKIAEKLQDLLKKKV